MIELAYMSIENMSADERAYLLSFLAPRNQREFSKDDTLCCEKDDRRQTALDLSMAGEALARFLLQKCAKGAAFAGDFHILRDANGKPYQDTVSGLFFNYSHSKNAVACAVADCEIGVDLQRIREGMTKKTQLLQRVYSSEEKTCEYWTDEAFAKIWAKKESYLKLTGEGLRGDMSKLRLRSMEGEAAQWFGGRVLDNYWLYACVRPSDKSERNRCFDKSISLSRCTISFDRTTDAVRCIHEAGRTPIDAP